MRWYRAILITIALMAIMIFAEPISTPWAHIHPGFIVGLSLVLWVAFDSWSIIWTLGVLVLWPLFFPWYLIVRGNRKRKAELCEEANGARETD